MKTYIKVSYDNSFFVDTIDYMRGFISNMEIGQSYKIEAIEMTEVEFEALPEFTGF